MKRIVWVLSIAIISSFSSLGSQNEVKVHVICNPETVYVNQATTVTILVEDISQTPSHPIGTINFVPTDAGLLQTEECALVPVGDGKTSQCSVLFTPTTGALPEVELAVQYSGDINHVNAQGTGTVKVKKRQVSLKIEWEGTAWASFFPISSLLSQTHTLEANVYDNTLIGTPTTPEGTVLWDVQIFYPGIGVLSWQLSSNPTPLVNGVGSTHLSFTFTGAQIPNAPILIRISASYSGSDVHEPVEVVQSQFGSYEFGTQGINVEKFLIWLNMVCTGAGIAGEIIPGIGLVSDLCDDLDSDGLPFGVETLVSINGYIGLAPSEETLNDLDNDCDDDGLSDGDEVSWAGGWLFGTAVPNPKDPDSDDDYIKDGDEVNLFGTDPRVADSDGDGLTDGEEIATFTLFDQSSSFCNDNPQIWSELEAIYNLSNPLGTTEPRNHSNPLAQDTDGDGLIDSIEYEPGNTNVPRPEYGKIHVWEYDSFVNDPDTDDDGLQDGAEDIDGDGLWEATLASENGEPRTGHGETHPCLADTDGDGLSDGEEVALFGEGEVHVITPYGTTTNPALDTDSDDDGLSDYEEVNVTFTDPLNYDTDGDGIWDVNELKAIGGEWPHRQFQQISDPLDPDTDDDGLPDNIEYDGTGLGTGHSSPGGSDDTLCPSVNDADSDDDGLQDGYEDANHDGVITNTIGDSTSEGSGETDFCDPDSDDDGLLDGEEEGLFGQEA
ncbi:hypothetical protein J7M00_07845, partial [bacterium]|nr:hypothetical protein [bacterium]